MGFCEPCRRVIVIVVMRVLCVGRHHVLSEHVASIFRHFGAETHPVVGLDEAAVVARSFGPEVVICDYDLLATVSLAEWERDEALSRLPIVAVSLTRRPDEVHLLDVNNVAGFLYLPALEHDDAQRLLGALRRPEVPELPRPAKRNTPESLSAC